ncbi:MAG: hypothetical protein ACFB2Z_00205, partial [Maricaulaceae bacterium]
SAAERKQLQDAYLEVVLAAVPHLAAGHPARGDPNFYRALPRGGGAGLNSRGGPGPRPRPVAFRLQPR